MFKIIFLSDNELHIRIDSGSPDQFSMELAELKKTFQHKDRRYSKEKKAWIITNLKFYEFTHLFYISQVNNDSTKDQ